MPVRPSRPCSYPGCCMMAISGTSRCEKHKVTHGWKHTKTRHERGYGNDWYKLKGKALKRDNYLCQVCEDIGVITAAKEVDHIIPKSEGGTDSLDNLQSICVECHKQKTIKEAIRGRK